MRLASLIWLLLEEAEDRKRRCKLVRLKEEDLKQGDYVKICPLDENDDG